MSVEIKSETLTIGGTDATLISVKNGEAAIGTCNAGYLGLGGVGTKTRLFFIGSDPIATVLCPNHGNEQTDKLISLCPGYSNYDREIKKTIDACFEKLNSDSEHPINAIREILGLLEDGVYALYFSEYYPTDGSGTYFWGAYNIPHDVHGTAERNRLVKNNVFKPCFLVPTQPLDYYVPKVKAALEDAVKNRPVQGIVYHLSGFHSMLIKGHHGSVACVEKEVPFRCLVIEKVYMPYVDPIELSPAPVAEVPEDGAVIADESAEKPAEQQPEKENSSRKSHSKVIYPEGITGFRGASIKIPLELFPKEMLRYILTTQPEYKPRQFDVLTAKLSNTSKKTLSNNVLPHSVLEKADTMPDCEMLESAYAIKSLSDEQLNCLLAGDVECNGEVIISPNFYSSIVIACNFLQFTDPNRFVDFAIAVMDNPELIAAHDYVSHRSLTQSSNSKLQRFFQNVVDSEDAKYSKVTEAAQTFLRRLMENK
ncbi:MAG: hypothetical protein ACI4JS_07685 [Oscillospiraceae bacterium]